MSFVNAETCKLMLAAVNKPTKGSPEALLARLMEAVREPPPQVVPKTSNISFSVPGVCDLPCACARDPLS